jgi:hypothetical protein
MSIPNRSMMIMSNSIASPLCVRSSCSHLHGSSRQCAVLRRCFVLCHCLVRGVWHYTEWIILLIKHGMRLRHRHHLRFMRPHWSVGTSFRQLHWYAAPHFAWLLSCQIAAFVQQRNGIHRVPTADMRHVFINGAHVFKCVENTTCLPPHVQRLQQPALAGP